MPAVTFFACLDFERKSLFCKRLSGFTIRADFDGGALSTDLLVNFKGRKEITYTVIYFFTASYAVREAKKV